MKPLAIVLTFLISLPAFCQTDSLFLYSTGQSILGDSIVFPSELFKRGAAVPRTLNFSLRKAKVHRIAMGMDAMYLPKSDIAGANVSRSLTQILTYQLPLSTQVTEEQLKAISEFIKTTTEPVVLPTPQTMTIDNVPDVTVNGQLVNSYVPAWTHANVQGHFNNTISYSAATNATLTTKFSGSKIEWIGEKKDTHGKADVFIDDVLQTTIDLYSSTEQKQVSLFQKSVPVGPHTIKIRVTGTKNTASKSAYIVHDSFRVTF